MKAVLLLVLLAAAAQVLFPPWRVSADVRTLIWDSPGALEMEVALGLMDSPLAYQFRVDTARRTAHWEVRGLPLWANPGLSEDAFTLEQLFGTTSSDFGSLPVDSMVRLLSMQDSARQHAYSIYRVPTALRAREVSSDSLGLRKRNRKVEFDASFSIDTGRLGLQLLLTALLGGGLAVTLHRGRHT